MSERYQDRGHCSEHFGGFGHSGMSSLRFVPENGRNLRRWSYTPICLGSSRFVLIL